MLLGGGESVGSKDTNNGGNVEVYGGTADAGDGGSLLLRSGASDGGDSGSAEVKTPDSGTMGVSGDVTLRTGGVRVRSSRCGRDCE